MEHGFPHDEVLPLTCSGQDTWGPFALTLVDSLDTYVTLFVGDGLFTQESVI